eukprot:11390426-Alexandrium_andersonii.AAC.1
MARRGCTGLLHALPRPRTIRNTTTRSSITFGSDLRTQSVTESKHLEAEKKASKSTPEGLVRCVRHDIMR